MAGEGAFTRAQLAALTQFVEAWAQERASESDPRGLLPGTVKSYDPASRQAVVLIDGDDNPIPVFNKEYPVYQAGDRVFVKFEPPRGVFIDGTIRAALPLYQGLFASGVQSIPDDGGSTTALNQTAGYDPFGFLTAPAEVTIPTGMSGAYAITLHAEGPAVAFTRFFCEWVESETGRTIRSTGGTETVQTASATMWLPEATTIDLHAYQTSGAARSITSRLDVALVVPSRTF